MSDSSIASALKERFAGFDKAAPPSRFALGPERLDAVLGGGLARARLHEAWPANAADQASAAGFALMLAVRAAEAGRMIAWIAQDEGQAGIGPLYPPGLAELGADAARFLFVTAPDEKSLLRTAGDVVRSPAIGCAVIAPGRKSRGFTLTATRRLTLFAERSGVTAILLRGADPESPSAAATRWRIAAAPSRLLEAEAPGHPAFTADLVRQRGGAPSSGWRLEWQRDDTVFAPLSRSLSADAGGGLLAVG
jgi:protein ImuA